MLTKLFSVENRKREVVNPHREPQILIRCINYTPTKSGRVYNGRISY